MDKKIKKLLVLPLNNFKKSCIFSFFEYTILNFISCFPESFYNKGKSRILVRPIIIYFTNTIRYAQVIF
jgi:hypothetical protein